MNITHYHGRVNNRVNMACEFFRARVERIETHFLAHVTLFYYSRSSTTPFWSCRTTLFVAVSEKKTSVVCQHRSIKVRWKEKTCCVEFSLPSLLWDTRIGRRLERVNILGAQLVSKTNWCLFSRRSRSQHNQ